MAQLPSISKKITNQSFQELYEFLSIPNDAHFPSDIEKNLIWLEDAFHKRDFQTSQLATSGSPLLLAKKDFNKNFKTVLFYMHFDGQPVDAAQWFQKSPYSPVLKERNQEGKWVEKNWNDIYGEYNEEWRIFARSASDDKSPIIMLLTALDVLEEEHKLPAFNIKVILDSEEEMGSPYLAPAIKKYEDQLKADYLLILDGPRHISNQPTLTFGARGIIDVDITVFGPKYPLHSGHYGNYAPNPAFLLSELLASLKDKQGRVVIPGFYEGVELTDAIKSELSKVPDDEVSIQRKIGIAKSEEVGNNYQESIQYPSLNIKGMASGWVGDEARTIVPSTATVTMDIRLVPESDPERLITILKDHIQKQGFHLVDETPTDEERSQYSRLASYEYSVSYGAFRTELDSEMGKWLTGAMFKTFGKEPIKIRIGGGSVPIAPFINTLNIPAVLVPVVNSDNNQHSPNENLRLGNYIEGIKTCVGILSEPLD